MSDFLPEFSRLVPLARLGFEPFRQRIEATRHEREQLSARLDLVSLDRLIAAVALRRQSREVIRFEAEFEAEFVQSCVVTLEPVPGTICGRFSLVYAPPETAPEEAMSSADEAVFEPLSEDAIDIGEAVAQELSLSLPVFPRCPEASAEIETQALSGENPFALLDRRRQPTKS